MPRYSATSLVFIISSVIASSLNSHFMVKKRELICQLKIITLYYFRTNITFFNGLLQEHLVPAWREDRVRRGIAGLETEKGLEKKGDGVRWGGCVKAE